MGFECGLLSGGAVSDSSSSLVPGRPVAQRPANGTYANFLFCSVLHLFSNFVYGWCRVYSCCIVDPYIDCFIYFWCIVNAASSLIREFVNRVLGGL